MAQSSKDSSGIHKIQVPQLTVLTEATILPSRIVYVHTFLQSGLAQHANSFYTFLLPALEAGHASSHKAAFSL